MDNNEENIKSIQNDDLKANEILDNNNLRKNLNKNSNNSILQNIPEEPIQFSKGEISQLRDEINEEIKKLKKENKKITDDIKNLSIKSIEQLTFFTAIISFILSSVLSISKSWKLYETLLFILALGCILIIFNVSGSIFLRLDTEDSKKDVKIKIIKYILIGLLIIIIISYIIQYYLNVEEISKILEILRSIFIK